jgi:teichuronic acid biosynthesis glycosyltransferase TuaG
MSNKNCVDIILPTYNSEKFIIKTVNSIINQSYSNWRIIIIDDASTDKTLEILYKFYANFIKIKKIYIIKNLKNKGQSYCRNLGIKYSYSKFIAFIDSDDLWLKKKLETQIKFMINNNYVFTYTDYIISKNKKKKNILTPSNYNFFTFVRNTSIATSTMIISRNIINFIFKNEIRLCEDYLFKCRLLKKYMAYKCPGFLTKYIIRNNSLQSSRIKVLFAVWNINKTFNNMNILKNFSSIVHIVINSLLKYGIR